MFRIGIISDTHGLLRPEVEQCFRGTAHIIHAGDIGAEHVMEGLRRIAPVTAIRGNVDVGDWARFYPETTTVHLAGRAFYVLHDINDLKSRPAPADVDAVISGHSHRASLRTTDGITYLNPGSAGPRRFKLPITLATIDIDEHGEVRVNVRTLDECSR
ncbi:MULTISPECIES: metallophosphoesterase family protein [unclassified Bradyrhizobium]|uniref:metallophosphoesterase family protein n=1 Tax=unclassified Bradyrhizobium TaxID=2631580 RepID=UPI0023067255|nr:MULTISPECIES: metallophosphoesterase family protein [unclassified Bradyrhizobium]MDA9409687.1 phosphodiesterase [Bradyrhizobium sp. CCBAU 45384]MDA9438903.1 phosphodiesterase [Bradyrhizobium sp. CCBAU 51745]